MTEVADGLEAKEILEQDMQFDLLISDFRMPRWTGVDLLNWCRTCQIHFPVIFISATSSLLAEEEFALADCCASLLSKPLDLDELLGSIDDAFQRQKERDCSRSPRQNL